jgi:uncharacterized RDD family membrane protein YckC
MQLPESEPPRDAIQEGQAAVAASSRRSERSTATRSTDDHSRPRSANARRSEPPPPPLSTALPPDPSAAANTQVPVSVASGFRIAVAWTVDALLVLGVGGSVAALEAVAFGDGPSGAKTPYMLDAAANWIAAYPEAALHGVIAAVLFGFGYALRTGKHRGQTVGRRLSGTILIRASGRELGWPLVIVRTVAGSLSLALFGAGFFWSIVDRRGRTWHDLLVGTVIVRRPVEDRPEEAIDRR